MAVPPTVALCSGRRVYARNAVNTTPTVEQLTRCREAIHLAGEVPDVTGITGATGETSGIALQLKFLPMLQAANAMTHLLKACIRERIELLTRRAEQVQGEEVSAAGVNIKISLTLPTNRIEEYLHGLGYRDASAPHAREAADGELLEKVKALLVLNWREKAA